jgi:hypothetical protein
VPISFDEWIVDKLPRVYNTVSDTTAREWLDKNQFVLLLDGLDEVAEAKRDGCMQAINSFRKDLRYEAVNVVMCSRLQEYQQLATKAYLQAAVILQPLTDEQIDGNLEKEAFKELRRQLHADVVMREMARGAFLLNIMMRVYQGVRAGDIVCEGPPEKRIQELFRQYIEARLRKQQNVRYSSKESLHYLSWLASTMRDCR